MNQGREQKPARGVQSSELGEGREGGIWAELFREVPSAGFWKVGNISVCRRRDWGTPWRLACCLGPADWGLDTEVVGSVQCLAS